jgi:hypothetical protein
MVDQIIAMANAVFSGLIAAVSTWAILSHRVRDGVVIKTGLILMSIGCAVTAAYLFNGISCQDLLGLNRARLVTLLGMSVIAFGYWLSLRSGKTLSDLVDMPRRGVAS